MAREALPIEVDAAPWASADDAAAVSACDDSAQRFALIEIDAAAPAG